MIVVLACTRVSPWDAVAVVTLPSTPSVPRLWTRASARDVSVPVRLSWAAMSLHSQSAEEIKVGHSYFLLLCAWLTTSRWTPRGSLCRIEWIRRRKRKLYSSCLVAFGPVKKPLRFSLPFFFFVFSIWVPFHRIHSFISALEVLSFVFLLFWDFKQFALPPNKFSELLKRNDILERKRNEFWL